jgi:hypothetical protein
MDGPARHIRLQSRQARRRPVSFGMGGFYNVERPAFANHWTARFTITLVFPE